MYERCDTSFFLLVTSTGYRPVAENKFFNNGVIVGKLYKNYRKILKISKNTL